MFGFSFGKKRILGIDVGTSTIKMVELEFWGDKPPRLSNYAWMDIPETSKGNGGNNKRQENFGTVAAECLKKMYKEAEFTAKGAYVSVSAFGGMVTIIDLPAMPESELEQAVRFEAHKYIPTSLDEVAISWEVIDGGLLVEKENKTILAKQSEENDVAVDSPKKIQVFLAAALKSEILTYEKMIALAGLKLKGIEIESISMVESLVGNDQGSFIIVDIGSRVCNVIYVEKGIIRASRNIDAGGADITRTIAKSMNISEERAESFKTSGKNFFSADSSLRFSTLDMIFSEVARILEVSSKNKGEHNLGAIILSGGTAGLIGLDAYFQSKFGVKTIIGNPFGRIDYDKKLEPKIEKIKSEFSVCVGLALKETEKQI